MALSTPHALTADNSILPFTDADTSPELSAIGSHDNSQPVTNPRRDLLVWIDMEMTGLDPDRDQILEIASLITDSDLEIVAEGPVCAIHHPDEVFAAMDSWNREHHTESGLLDRCRTSGITVQEAEQRTLSFVRAYCEPRSAPLCGNSVWQDRRFLARYMKELDQYLHYRIVDVSTIKELVRRWFPGGPPPPQKRKAHLAASDILESIQELRFYREHYFRKPTP
ncbi:MAG: oligoribonuclease [Candidatus Binatia bacterium]|nr:MAG: oligoribonuclease [Candidatus Binatia bacterium]